MGNKQGISNQVSGAREVGGLSIPKSADLAWGQFRGGDISNESIGANNYLYIRATRTATGDGVVCGPVSCSGSAFSITDYTATASTSLAGWGIYTTVNIVVEVGASTFRIGAFFDGATTITFGAVVAFSGSFALLTTSSTIATIEAVYRTTTPLTVNQIATQLKGYDAEIPTAFFNGADLTVASSYSGGPVLYQDADGDLRYTSIDTPGVSGLSVDGWASVTSTSQKTRTAANSGFTIFTNSTKFKRYISDDPTLLPGLVTAPARTNLCTPMKVNPTVTTGLSLASGEALVYIESGKEALIAEAGLQNICTLGSLYKVVATTNSVVAIGGAPGVDTTCSGSMYVAVEVGSASLRMAGTNRVTTTDPKLVKLRWDNQAVLATNPLSIFVAAGSTVYFIGFQYEAGTFGTDLIINNNDATGAAVRSNTVVKFPTSGKIRSNNMAFRVIAFMGSAGQVGAVPFGIYYDTNKRVRVLINQTNVQFAVSTLSLASIYVNFSHTYAVGDCIDCVCTKTINGAELAARVYRNGAWGAWTIATPNTTEAAKGAMSIPTYYNIGSIGSAGYLSGSVKLFDTLLIPDYALTNPLAWAMAQWRL